MIGNIKNNDKDFLLKLEKIKGNKSLKGDINNKKYKKENIWRYFKMKFIIDDANIAKVKEIWDLYPCDGVTTNPSILAKSGRNPYEVLSELREIVGKDGELHVQVVSKDAEGMMEEAKVIREKLGDSYLHTNAGIPCSKSRS